jgi:hypothetical protein
MGTSQVSRIAAFLSTAALLLAVVPTPASAEDATGHFEVYCDGGGFFLAKVDGAPAPRKLLLFLYTGRVSYVPKEEWNEVIVYRNGCAADGKCEVLTHGKVRLDSELTRDGRRVSGKYEIELSDQHLHGQFATERRFHRHSPRICE